MQSGEGRGSPCSARQLAPKSQGPARTQIALNQPRCLKHPEERAEGALMETIVLGVCLLSASLRKKAGLTFTVCKTLALVLALFTCE